MKITIEKATLARILAHVAATVARRSNIPIVECVRLDAATEDGEGRLRAQGTDLDMWAATSGAAEIVAPGAICVNAARLNAIVKELPDGCQIELALDDGGGSLTLRAGRGRHGLAALPAEDFPPLPEMSGGVEIQIAAKDLTTMFGHTRYAVSTQETRHYLNGVYLESHGGDVLRAVATDGHRLGRVDGPAPDGIADIPSVIVPTRAVERLAALASTADSMTLKISEINIRAEAAGNVFVSKLIDGTFPDYHRVIPDAGDTSVTLAREPFMAAIRRVALGAGNAKSKGIRIEAGGEFGATVNITAQGEGGDAEENIDARIDGDGGTIGFNSAYLLDTLASCDGPDILMEIAGDGPARLSDPADDSFLSILMPIRV